MTMVGASTACDLVDEAHPLLRKRLSQPPSLRQRWHRHLTVNVSRDWADIVLVVCYLITGLLDSTSILVWGSFVSMQTGNTVYLGLGLASPHESTRWIKSAVSLGSFCVGSFLFSRFHRFFSPKRRWILCASFAVQAGLTATAAAIVTFTEPPPKDDIGWHVLVPISLVAFQSCGQAVISRALRYNTLNSVVLTSIYCDLFSDTDLFGLLNAERNRRVGAPLFLLLGAFLGGKFAHSSLGVAGALWAAALLKTVVILVWLVWPAARTPVVEVAGVETFFLNSSSAHSIHGGGGGNGTGCKISMLWNWNTIDVCFLMPGWNIRSSSAFAASCIGVTCFVVTLESLRRAVRMYDAHVMRDLHLRATAARAYVNGHSEAPQSVVMRASLDQQLVRAGLHSVTFGVAYIVMLLAMYYNGATGIPSLLHISLDEIAEGLDAGKFTVYDLIRPAWLRIREVDRRLHAVIQVNVDALETAKALDEELKRTGRRRGPPFGARSHSPH
ncbi:hypothetical protein B0H63DRAFT_555269 [Podospora didyma]|uniref:Copper transport protein n=1 Tax=Podospora didyma TaxID=330526 RepID=A0AAE0P612_9PEZI|nr:hypothetical protein B0H63DRAFT_555269 [Podospora didyma]